MTPGAHIGRLLRGVHWYLAEVSGETAYDRYVAHLRRHHPEREPPTRAAYYRQRMDDRDANPGARCC